MTSSKKVVAVHAQTGGPPFVSSSFSKPSYAVLILILILIFISISCIF